MDITIGLEFTGKYFTGNVIVAGIKNNHLYVDLEKDNREWSEIWDLQHTKWGFDRGEYFLKPTK